MIIQKNTFKQKSEAECDMCKSRMAGCDRISIKVGIGSNNPKKKWDLCKRCYIRLDRAIENWHKKIIKGE